MVRYLHYPIHIRIKKGQVYTQKNAAYDDDDDKVSGGANPGGAREPPSVNHNRATRTPSPLTAAAA